ncbi:MAG: response regulator [Spirochaetota bacterium]
MSKHILIVEDDQNIAKLIDEIVKRRGYSSVVASNGEQAYRLFGEKNFDLIITDLKMPKIDGMTLIKMVREKNTSIPIIIITGYGSEKSHKLAKSYGVFHILSKPCSIMDISRAIDEAFQ